MPSYTPPTKDMQFVLHDVLKITEQSVPGYEDLEADFTSAILEEAGKLTSEVLAPLNVVGDTEGCKLENGVVRTPTGFKEAFSQVREGGWPGLDMPEEYGGQNMPCVIGTAVGEMFSSANMAFTMYQGLTHGAASAILAHGTDAQKDLYLPKMVSCEWTGTMNLTEPHCGTDLGLMRTKAEPQADGSYKITGQKIFISAGEHDMSDNIIHLVLAKIVGGPEGIKGVSLFIVPKFMVNEDGSLGARNPVVPGGRTAQGHARHVHDDERGTPGRRHARPVSGRGRLSERAGIRQGPSAGPRCDRTKKSRSKTWTAMLPAQSRSEPSGSVASAASIGRSLYSMICTRESTLTTLPTFSVG